jgi:thioesterase domain-containing protein/aryl carrier-like protein
MYRTADLARWHENGTVEFLGRNDFQVKIRGYRIELGEIEARLMEYPGVQEAIVIVREDKQGDRRLAAYFTSEAAENEISAEILRTHLHDKLPEYMVPASYVRLEKMPLTANGKVDRQGLPDPDGDAYAQQRYEAPRGPVEEILAEVWSELLGVERVGRHDNFFELGGHSLLAVRAIQQLRQRGLEARLHELLSNPEMEAFASLLELPKSQRSEGAVLIRQGGAERPLFLTHEGADEIAYAWALAPHIDPSIPIYALPSQENWETRLRTIEGMAQRMVKMIRAVQPVGPYRIGGYSYGAYLAYEIAGQLIGADQEIELLALLDLHVFGKNDDRPLAISTMVNPDPRLDFLARVSYHVASSGMDDSIQRAVDELKQSSQTLEGLFDHCRDMGWLPEVWSEVTAGQLQRILTRGVEMKSSPYSISLLPVDVHLFVAKDDGFGSNLPERFATHVPGVWLRSILVPGTHRTMVQDPNIALLGQRLSEAIGEISPSRSHILRSNSPGSLVTLRPSTRDRAVPLFCVPGSGMSSNCFTDLASSFMASRPVYAFQARGLDGHGVPHSTVEAAAKLYLRELERVCPDGPIHLLGHLAGGRIAFEMASMLSAAGRSVSSITVLESDSPDESSLDFCERSTNEIVENLLEIIELSTGRQMISVADLGREVPARQREILQQLLVDSGLLQVNATTSDFCGLLQTLGLGLRTQYVPHQGYQGTVRAVAATERRDGAQENGQKGGTSAIGWKRWASQVVECGAPGNRISMLKPPHVSILAAMIEEEMNRTAN